MMVRNQHPDAHAAKSVETWEMTAAQSGTHWAYTNDQSGSRTFKPFRWTKLDGMNYLLRTSGYKISSGNYAALSDGSFLCISTALSESDVWIPGGKSCTPVEYCIVTPADYQLVQTVGVGCFTSGTAAY